MLCFVDENMQKLQSGWGSAPDPDGGAYSAPPYPLAGREGATPPPAPTPALNQFHLIAFPNPPVSRPAYGPEYYYTAGISITIMTERFCIDFAGPSLGKMWLLVLHAHSEWLDIRNNRFRTCGKHFVYQSNSSLTMDNSL